MKQKISIFLLFISILIFGQTAPSYYSSIDFTKTGNDMKDQLAVLITNTQKYEIPYGSETNSVLINSDADPSVPGNILLLYGSGTANDKNQRSRISSGSWNKEHTYPRSLGTPNLNYSGPGADAHHLRPTDVTKNSDRGNLLFADGSGAVAGATGGGGWYPGDEWRGDVARMMMFMYVRYNTRAQAVNVGLGPKTYSADMPDIFIKWNVQDPVSDFERQRNNYVATIQGNRNPFIDNPYLATIIWGGPAAQNTWPGNFSSDTVAPTAPTNLVVNGTTESSVSLSWSASTDNVAVAGYEIYVNGVLNKTVSETELTTTVTGLTSSTTYDFYVIAKDGANNKSTQSNTVQGTTTADTTPPSAPTNLSSSNVTSSTATLNWNASTDNVAVTGYNIYIDGNIFGTSTTNSFNLTGLSPSTTYSVYVEAYDAVGNKSSASNTLSLLTTSVNPPATTSNSLYFSEYVEGTSNNKALEITNPTSSAIDLTGYSIKKQVNGAGSWTSEYTLSGIINAKSALVFRNTNAVFSCTFTSTALGAPIDFNGNDPVALFKDGVLVDVIGTFGNTANFAIDTTLRRIVVGPSTIYNASDWESFAANSCDDLGTPNPSSVLNVNDNMVKANALRIAPNPVKNGLINIYGLEDNNVKVEIYNAAGQLLQTADKVSKNSNKVQLRNLAKGVYILKAGNQSVKFIVE